MAEDPLTTHARARVGRVLRGKWTLDRLIGVGGMAAVYEATHRNGSKVAIKMLHPTLMYDTNFAQRLVQEGYVANKINHAAAVKVFDDDTDQTDGTVFLVMELLEGQTLSQARRKKKRFPPLEALKMMIPVLECLGNAHERGIIHRDIKPENLFLTRDGVVHVLDFGIARISDGSSNVAATRVGMVVGSPAYMSPEQALGKMNSVGPQTDVYAVGATMFALLAGTTPHAGESTQEMIVMVATQAARPIASVAPDLPPSVARVIDKSLAYDRDKRYPDARAMLVDMQEVIAELEGTPKVLPTFHDDDEEGETTVNAAIQANGDNKAAPLPAAGMNRVGQRPLTGKFVVPPMAPAAIAEAFDAPPSPPPVPGNKPDDPVRARAATMAPIGAPQNAPGAFLPGAPVQPGHMSGPYAVPGLGSGMHNAPLQQPGQMPGGPSGAFSSGAHPAPMGAFPGSTSRAGDGFNNGLPQTMAIPMMHPVDIANPTGPGATSGPRPGATTNMAWATPPVANAEEPPPARKPRVGLFAAAAVGVLALGGVGFAVLGHSDAPPPVTRPARQTQIGTPPVVTPPTPQTPESPQAPNAPQTPEAAATDAGVEAPVAPPTTPDGPTQPVAQADPPDTTPDTAPDTAHGTSAHGSGHRNRARSSETSGTHRRTGRNRPRPGGDPLGY